MAYMKNTLKVVRRILVLVLAIGVFMVLQKMDTSVRAADDEVIFTGAKTIDLSGKTMSLEDFGKETTLQNRLKNLAELDDVDKEQDCRAMTGMKNVLITGFDVVSGKATSLQKSAMLYNTWFLQQLMYCSSKVNSPALTTIVLPEGTFYFVSGHATMADDIVVHMGRDERHVIKLHDNIILRGAGTEINRKKTVLKPYSEKSEFVSFDGGLDMFFYNELSAHDKAIYLKNIHFSDFVIDSAETTGRNYNTAGKGFMINLFENGTWQNITVRNTDATGFGVDCPIGDSWIANSRAYGNGKMVKGDVAKGGGSGFGIGTGYSDSEHFEIRNSIAEGNGKYGFFYEHQDRFGPSKYK